MGISNIKIYHLEETDKFFKNPSFLAAWDDLFQSCPWATVFQSRDFILTWFDCFKDYQPTIITDWDGQTMKGLWVLTESKGSFTGPGLDLAEYQVWLSTPEFEMTFVENALTAFVKVFPNKAIYMKYIPGSTPREVFGSSRFLKERTVWRQYFQPLMVVDKEALENELKKKNRKEKINRLNRLGELRFSNIGDPAHFKSLIDEMALQSDFRKGALYNKTFFSDEPQRKAFLLRLFELGHVHVTTLAVGDILIASNAGIMGRDIVHLQGINSHSPFYSKHSPGILHFLMLGIALSDAHIPIFDLTPGGADGYKAVLANRQDTAYEWRFGSKPYALRVRILESVKRKIKSYLTKNSLWGLDWQEILENTHIWKVKLKTIKNTLTLSKKRFSINFLASKAAEVRLPAWDTMKTFSDRYPAAIGDGADLRIQKNRIADLFLWQETESRISKASLFLDCLNRIEFGQQMFTMTESSKLIGIAWHIPPEAKKQAKEERNQTGNRPHVILFSCYQLGKGMDILEIFSQMLHLEIGEKDVPNCLLEFAENQKELKRLLT